MSGRPRRSALTSAGLDESRKTVRADAAPVRFPLLAIARFETDARRPAAAKANKKQKLSHPGTPYLARLNRILRSVYGSGTGFVNLKILDIGGPRGALSNMLNYKSGSQTTKDPVFQEGDVGGSGA